MTEDEYIKNAVKESNAKTIFHRQPKCQVIEVRKKTE